MGLIRGICDNCQEKKELRKLNVNIVGDSIYLCASCRKLILEMELPNGD